VVIATRDRSSSLAITVDRLEALPEKPRIIVVDNASTVSAVGDLRHAHPDVEILELPTNVGGAARNVGARQARTPYVAFADDDSWWDPGALPAAVSVMRADPLTALVAARILVGPEAALDPTSALMARGPLDSAGRPRPDGRRSVIGFLACGALVHRARFLAAGGFDPQLLVGGEEEALWLNLASAGWRLVYAPEAVVRHHPYGAREPARRSRLQARNALMVGWRYLPAHLALRRTLAHVARIGRDPAGVGAFTDALRRLSWAWTGRSPISSSTVRALAAHASAS
jgi:GT2 family glycosyltransferase